MRTNIEGLGAFRLGYVTDVNEAEVKICALENCAQKTRKGKPYCSNHVESHTYVDELLQRMQDRIDEDAAVLREGSKVANIQGITCTEIILQLRLNGPRTLDRLERELQISRSIIYKYTVALKREGLVIFGRTTRGNTTVALVNEDEELKIVESD